MNQPTQELQLVVKQMGLVASPWLDTRRAAEHLATSPARIHDLVALGKLTPRRDGRRLLFRRDHLDAYVEASA
jgi:excisionase family DNA binding protein